MSLDTRDEVQSVRPTDLQIESHQLSQPFVMADSDKQLNLHARMLMDVCIRQRIAVFLVSWEIGSWAWTQVQSGDDVRIERFTDSNLRKQWLYCLLSSEWVIGGFGHCIWVVESFSFGEPTVPVTLMWRVLDSELFVVETMRKIIGCDDKSWI